MIRDKTIAAEISALMLELGGLINESLASVQKRCSAAEFELYQKACDTLLMDILMELMNPIQELHPDLPAVNGGADDRAETPAANPPRWADPPRRDPRPQGRLRLVPPRPRPQREP